MVALHCDFGTMIQKMLSQSIQLHWDFVLLAFPEGTEGFWDVT